MARARSATVASSSPPPSLWRALIAPAADSQSLVGSRYSMIRQNEMAHEHEFDFLRWQLDWLVRSPDGRWRLPSDSEGQLPLSFSLKATKPA